MTETMVQIVDVVLLVLLAITGIAVIRTRNLFAAVMLAGIYSLVSAGLFVVMDAVDVAFTEAAVGAGISTVLLLGTLALVGYKESKPEHTPLLPLFVIGFLVMVVIRSADVLSDDLIGWARDLEKILLTAALVGLGSGVRIDRLRKLGAAPLLLGLSAWIVVAGVSLAATALLI